LGSFYKEVQNVAIFFPKLLILLGTLGLLTIVKPALAQNPYFIRNDATGGDCTSIGNWDAATKTCLLTQDVQGGIEVADNNLTLDGNGYIISPLSVGSGTGVLLSSRSGVTLQKLNVQSFSDGIQLISANSNTLTGNTTSNNSHAGILLRSSSLNTLSGNTASSTTSGGSGIWLWNQSNSNTLTGNITVGNSAYGIFLDANSDRNSLTWNSTSLDSIGIRLIFSSDSNTVAYNTISNTRQWGMDLFSAGNNNLIYNNNFIDNNTTASPPLRQIRVVSSPGNVFNLSASAGGDNYWNDYDSSAEGCNDVSPADGFCDQPYMFDGGPDNLPLTSPISPDKEGPVVSDVTAVPDPAQVGASITLTAIVNDLTTGKSNIESAEYRLYDNYEVLVGSGPMAGSFDSPTETVTAMFFAPVVAGVYDLCVLGTDEAGNTGLESCAYLVVYDASAGFVTGGGWIDSPAGACRLTIVCETAMGKANFGFVSKYKKGATVPSGDTEFQFKAGNLNFRSNVYQWLVVAGALAQFKGWGTINGEGSYEFMLTAIDGQITGGRGVDRFRIKIWENNEDSIVYDNQPTGDTQVISGGSIVIHK
jgi:parallel beta-helix repeat protein